MSADGSSRDGKDFSLVAETKRLVEQGLFEYGLGHAEGAIALWEAALGIDPDNARARRYLDYAWGRSLLGAETKPAPAAESAPAPNPVPRAARRDATLGSSEPSILGDPSRTASDAVRVGSPPTPAPVAAPAPTSAVEPLRVEMNERFALGNYTGALEIAQAILSRVSGDVDARGVEQRARAALLHIHQSKLGHDDECLERVISPEDAIWLSLTEEESAVFQRIDGKTPIRELLPKDEVQRLETARFLARLVEEGAIALRRAAAPAD